MALIIYPASNSDSFVSVVDADDYISKLTLDFAQWDALSTEDKERYLRIAYRDIIDHTTPDDYPDPLPDCVGESQSLMAVHDLVNELSGGATSTQSNLIKRNKVGSIEQEFYSGYKMSKGVGRVPDSAYNCLENIGYNILKLLGFSQSKLGRS